MATIAPTSGTPIGGSSPPIANGSPANTSPASPPVPSSLFWISLTVNLGVRALTHSDTVDKFLQERGLPKVSRKLDPMIGIGTGIGTMYGFYGLGLIQKPNLGAIGFQTLPLNGFTLTLPYGIDFVESVVSKVPYVNQTPYLDTLQAGHMGNNFLTYGIVIWNSLRLFTRTGWAAKVITVSEKTGAFTYNLGRAGWVGVAFLIAAAGAKALDMIVDGIDDLKVRESNPTLQMKKEAEIEMEDLVYTRWFQEGAHDLFGRSFGGFISATTTNISKHTGPFIDHLIPTLHCGVITRSPFFKYPYCRLESIRDDANFIAQKDIVRAKMITEFNEWARLKIAEAIAKATYIDRSNTPQLYWSGAERQIEKAYSQKESNPDRRSDLSMFYNYDYEAHPIESKWFPGGNDTTQEVKKIIKLVSETGSLDRRTQPGEQEEVIEQQIALIDLTLEQLDPIYQELRRKYPDEQLNQIPQEEQNENPEIVKYLALEEQLSRLVEVKLTIHIERLKMLLDENENLKMKIEDQNKPGMIESKLMLVQEIAQELKAGYVALRSKYGIDILEEPIKLDEKLEENRDKNVLEPGWLESIFTFVKKEYDEYFSDKLKEPIQVDKKIEAEAIKKQEVQLYRDRYEKLKTLVSVNKALLAAQAKRDKSLQTQ